MPILELQRLRDPVVMGFLRDSVLLPTCTTAADSYGRMTRQLSTSVPDAIQST